MSVIIQKLLAASSEELKQMKESTDTRGYATDPKYTVLKGHCGIITKGAMNIIGDCLIDIVLWCSRTVSLYPIRNHSNAISFDFSGCVMSKFKWHGRWYAAHIHTSTDVQDDRRIEWVDFMRREGFCQLSMFRPEASDPSLAQTWGVITEEDEQYSVILDNEYNVQAVYSHIPYGDNYFDYKYLMELPILTYQRNQDWRERTYDMLKERWENFWNRSPKLYWTSEVHNGKWHMINKRKPR